MVATNTQTEPMSVADFLIWCQQPEQEGRRFELVRGEVVEMPPAGDLHGTYCCWIGHLLWMFVMSRGKGRVNSNDTGLIIKRRKDTVRGADLMFFNETTPPEKIVKGHVTDVPTLIVEVFSPSDRPGKLSQRITDYFAHGVPLVWVVYPEDLTVDVYRPGHTVEPKTMTDMLVGYEALSDLSLKVADLFNLPGSSVHDSTPN